MTNIQEITVAIDDKPPFEYIISKEGEADSRIIKVGFIENNIEYKIPANTMARIKIYKPDGNKILNDCTIADNKVVCTLSEQMLSAAGVGKGEILLYNNNSVLIGATFYIKIVEGVYKNHTLISDNDYFSLNKIMIETIQVRESLENAYKIAETQGEKASEAADKANTAATAANKAASTANTATTAATTAAQAAQRVVDNVSDITAKATAAAEATKKSEETAATYKEDTQHIFENTKGAEAAAAVYKDNAKSYMDNAKSYMDTAKNAAASITGALKPKGTVTYTKLPQISVADVGDMYNISTDFKSTADFKDGGDIQYPAGTNVYKTEDNKWDCLGGELSNYLMLDDVDTVLEEAMPDYTESTDLQELIAGERLKSTLGKIKTAVKNVIAITKLLGNTDISNVGNGTVTGAISTLNSNITTTCENAIITYAPALALVNIMPVKLTNTVAIRSWTTVATLPEEYRPSKVIKFPVTVYNPAGVVAYGQLTPVGALQIYSDTEIKVNQGQTYYNFTYFI